MNELVEEVHRDSPPFAKDGKTLGSPSYQTIGGGAGHDDHGFRPFPAMKVKSISSRFMFSNVFAAAHSTYRSRLRASKLPEKLLRTTTVRHGNLRLREPQPKPEFELSPKRGFREPFSKPVQGSAPNPKSHLKSFPREAFRRCSFDKTEIGNISDPPLDQDPTRLEKEQ